MSLDTGCCVAKATCMSYVLQGAIMTGFCPKNCRGYHAERRRWSKKIGSTGLGSALLECLRWKLAELFENSAFLFCHRAWRFRKPLAKSRKLLIIE